MFDVFDGALELAGPVLTLAAIAGLGYKIGEHFGKLTAAREADKEHGDTELLLGVARKAADAQREEALRWKSKFEEVAADADDKRAVGKLNRLRELIDKQESIWYRPPLSRPPIRPLSMGGRPILTVANLKGGVGKTTIATHLAAILGRTRKVLFIDLDFQGSGSSFLLRDAERLDLVSFGDRSKASRLIGRIENPAEVHDLAISLGDRTPGVSVVPAYYPLADAEERLMLRWLLEEESDDIRYNLRKLLHSDHFDWDIIIIDAAPRLSTAMAQAIAASTHILIPTQYERKSSEAALYFTQVLNLMMEHGVAPEVKVLGIVPSMIPQENQIDNAEVNALKTELARFPNGADLLWEDTPIGYRAAFRRPNLVSRPPNDAGSIAAVSALEALAAKVSQRIWNAAA